MSKKINWQAKSIRCTGFPYSEITGDAKLLWPKNKKFQLEKQTIHPKTGENTLEGSIENQKVTIKSNPFRLDLVIISDEVIKFDPTITMPTLGSYKEVLDRYCPLIEEWIHQEAVPDLKRLAFGADLVEKVDTISKGYEMLSEYLPLEIDSKRSVDFSYQINIPTVSKLDKDLIINRLTKWNVLNFQLELISSMSPESKNKYPTVYLNHLELDINTGQTNTKRFDENMSSKLFKELVDNSIGVSAFGIK